MAHARLRPVRGRPGHVVVELGARERKRRGEVADIAMKLGALAALVFGQLFGCARYVATEVPENCVESKWDVKLGSCREVMTGRFTLPECCGLEEREWCGFVPWVCTE